MLFADGSEIVMQQDGNNTKEIADKQINEISKYCSGVTCNKTDDVNMSGKRCLCCKRCPASKPMAIAAGLLFTIIYTALWFYIAFAIDGDIKFMKDDQN